MAEVSLAAHPNALLGCSVSASEAISIAEQRVIRESKRCTS